MRGEREKGKKKDTREMNLVGRYNFQSHILSDLLPPAQIHLLKFLAPSKILPSRWDQVCSTHEPVGIISGTHHNRQ